MSKPRFRRSAWPLVALALCIAAIGCEGSNDGDEYVPPPISVRSSVPAPNAAAGSDLTTIEIVFTRAPVPATTISWIFPAPPTAGHFGPTRAGSRQWNWLDLGLDIEAGGYHVLVDGAEMANPFSLSFGVDPERNSAVGIGGRVRTPSFGLVDPEGTVVFALPFQTSFNPSQPSSWADVQDEILAVTAVVDDNASVDEPLQYRLEYLEPERIYYLVAIKDTDGDQVYDPVRDWWAISRDEDGVFGFAPARLFGSDDKEEGGEVSVNLFLGPPSSPPVDEVGR